MPRIDLHTTVGFYPRPKLCGVERIIRGATASLNYNLLDKIYTIDNIGQFTYLLKQGRDTYVYNMIDYFTPTEDREAAKDTSYFEKHEINVPGTSRYEFIEIDLPVGTKINPGDNLYESTDFVPGEENENWQFNPHFEYVAGENYRYINFMLLPVETQLFKPTAPDCLVQAEAAIQLITNKTPGMHGVDSTIVERQKPIMVIDSLYGGFLAENQLVCSNSTYCANTLICNN